MPHLSQIIAIEKDIRAKAERELTSARAVFGNRGLVSGLARSYTPLDDEGEQLPGESTKVQFTARTVLSSVQQALTEALDIVATKDAANCHAKADVLVDGKPLLTGVPATTLLFLEKQLAELHSFAKTIPTLDAAEEWHFDSNQDVFATAPAETTRAKKVFRNHVLVEATQHHPAQVQVFSEDLPAGRWKTIKYSGAMPVSELNAMLARIERLQRAVKMAREEANRAEAKTQQVGETLLRYLFG
jgi:hypothetical protein